MTKKIRANVTITNDTKERLLQYGYENNVPGGLSGALEYITWHVLKVKNSQIRGQQSLDLKPKK